MFRNIIVSIIVSVFLLCPFTAHAQEVTIQHFDVITAAKTLLPGISQARAEMVKNVLESKASLYGFGTQDYPVILALVMTESSFQHIRGKGGEVGLLQVVPAEKHIRAIVAKIKCLPSEKHCLPTGRPDLYRKSMILTAKVDQFLMAHPHYALEAGLGELKFWKSRYEKRLKKYFWTAYPEWYLSQKTPHYPQKKEELQKWWKITKNATGALAWVHHHNWGSKMVTTGVYGGYGMKVLRFYNAVLGRKANTVFSPMKSDTSEE